MESCDEHQGKVIVESYASRSSGVSGGGDRDGIVRIRCTRGASEILVDASKRRMGNQKDEEVGDIIAETRILRVGIVLGVSKCTLAIVD